MPESPRRPKKKISSTEPVVASLHSLQQHPYSSIALSPDKHHAVTACKDTIQILRIGPSGIRLVRAVQAAHHFRTNVGGSQAMASSKTAPSFVLGLGQNRSAAAAASQTPAVNVVISDVAWSCPQRKDDQDEHQAEFIAAAGSNGVIVVWDAETLLDLSAAASPLAAAPDAVLCQHSRAVNRLAWHPVKPGLLLSAAQDGTVLLWERRKAAGPNSSSRPATMQKSGFNRLFGASRPSDRKRQAWMWQCRATFEPRSEAVRDIRWSPHYDDVFALVTSTGSLIAYNMHVTVRAMVKITAAHSGDATTLDWHPTRSGIVATGGASDRCVKIWDLDSDLSMKKDAANVAVNYSTMTSRGESESSAENEGGNVSLTIGSSSTHPMSARTISSMSALNSSRHKGFHKNMLHVLSISASVTRLRWRPPANETFLLEDEDRHESMMAVATAQIKGASAGGSGLLALWSYHRPFMPLSVVEGHKEGAVTGFDWLDTPLKEPQQHAKGSSPRRQTVSADASRRAHQGRDASEPAPQYRTNSRLPGSHEVEAILYDNSENEELDRPVGIWQHVVSVGRDGRCLLQSFARGDRPISRVPPSCFAMANLSPFQKGYGSLQLLSIRQKVPSGPSNDFLLTGLRQDNVTAHAAGVFREVAPDKGTECIDPTIEDQWIAGKRLPLKAPEIVFSVVDQGDLDDQSKPVKEGQQTISVAPEVMHLSRFADRYVLYPTKMLTSRVALCLHNGKVAQSLRCGPLAHMWRMVASIIESAGMDGLPNDGAQPVNVMQFVLLPTMKSLLEERADAGDVQTCVALCEVLQVINPDQTVLIPGLEINLVREWYLSYIDLLRDMCLFSHATFLIRSCKDPFISALNQQSTTIHESCPHCGKAFLSADETGSSQNDSPRRACRSCRKRIGLCFLCHEPVKGVYVWCPGCGHGGHLDHALQWFRGLKGKGVREVCPTGCGHKCNMLQQLNAFPRTDSFREFSQSPDQIDLLPPGAL